MHQERPVRSFSGLVLGTPPTSLASARSKKIPLRFSRLVSYAPETFSASHKITIRTEITNGPCRPFIN